jgi:hypothetical protein
MVQEDIEKIKVGNSYFNTDEIRQSAITYLKKHEYKQAANQNNDIYNQVDPQQ